MVRDRVKGCGSASFWVSALAVALLAGLLTGTPARAGDLDSAKQALEKVKGDLSSNSYNSIDADIKATEEFLDGLPDAERAPVQKELDALKIQAAAGVKDYKSKLIVTTSTRFLDSAADTMAQYPQGAIDPLKRAADQLNSDDAKKYVDPDTLKKLQGRLAALQKIATGKVSGAALDHADTIMKELDDLMASQPFKSASSNEDIDHVTQDISRLESRIRGAIEGIPADNPRVKAINDKMAKYDKQVDSAADGAMKAQVAKQLADSWKGQQEYFAGWDTELKGPGWAEFSKTSSQEMYSLMMPKTIELLTRASQWLDENQVKTAAEKYKGDPAIDATLADAHRKFDTAAAKLNAAFNNVLAEAEKIDTPKEDYIRNRADMLATDADHWFKATPFYDANVARAKNLDAKWKGAVTGAAQAKLDLLKKMTDDANANWPKIAASFSPTDGFTPDKLDSFKGKVIHIKGNNRVGWDYDANTYDFARQVNGMVIAGKYNKDVRAAVEDAVKQTGQDLPEESYDLYAVVESPGKIQERTRTEGKVKVDGSEVGTVTTEGYKPVDCAVVRVIALHVGPVAVGSAADAEGASGGFSFFKLFQHLIELAICVAAAGLVVLKSRPALAAQPAGGAAGQLNTALAGNNIAYAGLALAILGVLWLLSKLIIGDLFPALSLTLAGLYVAGDWLRGRGILPAGVHEKLKPLALPIAGAVAFFGLLHVFLANWYFF